LTDEEIKRIEVLINQKVEENLTIDLKTMSLEEAEKGGALAFLLIVIRMRLKFISSEIFLKRFVVGLMLVPPKKLAMLR